MIKTLLQQTFRPLRRAGLFSMLLASTALAQVPTTNLVGIYPMEGNGNDVSAAGNNLIFPGTAADPTFGTDRFGNEGAAMHFNGAQFADFPDLNLGNNFTITMWLKSEVVNVRLPISGANYPNDSYQFLDLSVTGGSVDGIAVFQFRAFDGSYDAETGPMTAATSSAVPAILESDWYFIVLRNDNGTISMQVDNVIYPMINAAAAMNSLQMVVGKRAGAGSYDYQGFMDDLTIHNVALSTEEIAAIQTTVVTTPPQAWSIPVEVYSNTGVESNVHFGASEAATDGYDAALDNPAAPMPPSNYVRAFFNKSGTGSPYGDEFYGDVRSWYDLALNGKTWTLTTQTDVEGQVTVKLTVPEGFGYPVRLTDDVTGDEGFWSGDYLLLAYQADGETDRNFTISVGDNSAPEVILGGNLSAGSTFYLSGTEIDFGFGGSDASGVVYGEARISFDNFDTYSVLSSAETAKILALKGEGSSTYYSKTWENPADFYGWKTFGIQVIVTDAFGNSSNEIVNHTVASAVQTREVTAGWNLIGTPFLVTNGGKSGFLSDDLTSYYTYNWTGNSYVQNNNTAMGVGFWLGVPADATIDGEDAIFQGDVYHNLTSGWQIITNPYVLPANVYDDLQFFDWDMNWYTFDEALNEGWVTLPFDYNKAGGNYEETSTLEPFSGQWLGLTRADLTPKWTFPALNQQARKARTTPAQSTSTSFLSLSGVDKDGVVSTLSFGYDADATNGFDAAFDKLVPPMPPKGNIASISGASTLLGNRFSRLIFKGDETISTSLQIEGQRDEVVVLSWTGGDLSGKAELVVKGVSYDLKSAGTVSVAVGEEVQLILTPTTTANDDRTLPSVFGLSQNYPNPFNPSTAISYQVPASSDVKLSVINMLGQEVAVLVNGKVAAGSHTATFDASKLASGIYLYRLQSGSFVQMKKMTLLK